MIFSDEEERIENTKILKMLSLKRPSAAVVESSSKSKAQLKIVDFEKEMEAELDRRAFVVENEGGMEHQRSLSRSSSSSSLNSLPRTSKSSSDPKPCSSGSSLKQPSSASDENNTSVSKKSVKFLEPAGPSSSSSSSTANPTEEEGKKPAAVGDEFYDKVYFDSDGSDGEDDVTKNRKTSKRKFMSNDDLFYDPNSDAEDQAWIDRQRRKQYCKQLPKNAKKVNASAETSSKGESSKTPANDPPLPTSDAVLNCPACFSVLSLDCQRHEFYVGQYRAMFVLNCKIDRSEVLKVPLKGNNKGRGRKNKNGNRSQSEVLENLSNDPGDTFFPVKCTICNTQVAMYDREEIFHFFNCLASNP